MEPIKHITRPLPPSKLKSTIISNRTKTIPRDEDEEPPSTTEMAAFAADWLKKKGYPVQIEDEYELINMYHERNYGNTDLKS